MMKRRKCRKYVCLLVVCLLVLNTTTIRANEFEEADKKSLKTTFTMYPSYRHYHYKITVKKTGNYTFFLDTKVPYTYIRFFSKNGKYKKPLLMNIKEWQGGVDSDSWGLTLNSSDVTNRCKCSFTTKLKKGTYVIRVYGEVFCDADKNKKMKIKTNFKKKK